MIRSSWATPLRRLQREGGGLANDTAWAGASEGLQLVSSLGVFYIVSTRLGPAEYGLYAGVQAFAATLTALAGGWVVMLLLQEVIRERRSLQEVLPMALGPALAAGVVMTALAALFGPLLLRNLSWELVTVFTAAEVLGASAVQIGAGALQAVRGFAPAARLRASFLVVRLATVVVLLGLGVISLPVLAGSLLVVNTLSGAAVLVGVSRALDAPLRLGFPTWPELRSGLSYGGVAAAFGVQEDGDKALMVRFAPPVDAGLYAAGYRGVQLALLPIRALLSSSHNRFLVHDPGARGEHLRRSLRFTALAGSYGIVAGTLLIAAAPAVAIVLGSAYEEAVTVIRWVAPLVVLRAVSLFPFNGLMGLRRNGVRVGILVSSALANVVGTVLLIPRHSWRGAAAATVASELLFAVSSWAALVYFQRRHDRSIAGVAGQQAKVLA